MTTLIIKFMNCRTQEEVSAIVRVHGGNLPNPCNEKFFYHCARNARRRITLINKEKRKSWLITDKN